MKKKATEQDWEAVIGYLPRYNQTVYKQPKGNPRQDDSLAGKQTPRLSSSGGSHLSTPTRVPYSPRTPRTPRTPGRVPSTPPHHRTPSKSDRPTTARPRLPALAGHKSVVHLPDKVPDDDNGATGDIVLPSMATAGKEGNTAKRTDSIPVGAVEGGEAFEAFSTVSREASESSHHVDICHEWLADLEKSARTAQPRGPQNCTRWIRDVRQHELNTHGDKMLTQMQNNRTRKRVLELSKSLRSTAPAKDSNWMQYLRSLPLLASMRAAEIEEVYASLTTEEFARGDYVLRQHESFGEDVFVIFRGVASAYHTDSEFRLKKMATLREHASFGNAELICCPSTMLGYNADIIADTELACLRISRKLIGASEPEVPGHGRPVSPTKAAETLKKIRGLHLGGGWGDAGDMFKRRISGGLFAAGAADGDEWFQRLENTVGWTLRHQMLKEQVVVTESQSAVLDFVQRIEWFKSIPKGDLAQVMSKVHLLYYLEGDKLLQQGERGGALMFVMYQGHAEGMQYSARTGEMKRIAEYRSGDQFGQGAVLKSEAYEASVFARSDCKLIGIPRSLLTELGLFEGARHRFEEAKGEIDWAALRQHFAAYDKDSDGVLDREELFKLLRRLGFQYQHSEFELGFTMIETKLGSKIDFDAFKEFWLRCNFLDPLNVRQLGEAVREARTKSVDDAEVDNPAEVLPTRTEEEEEEEGLMAQAAEEARSIWLRYDVDASNALDKYEVRMLLIDLGFEDCSAARIEREMAMMDRDQNGMVDFEEFIYWWMPAKVQSHLDQNAGSKAGSANANWIQTHHPTLELQDSTVRAFFEFLHKDLQGEVSVIDMMKGVSAHPEEAAEFGFLIGNNEVDKEKVVVAFDAMRQPGAHRATVEDMINYFGPKGRHRGGGGLNSENFAAPRTARRLWSTIRRVL